MANITARLRFGPRPLSRAFRLQAGSSVDVTVEFRDDAGVPVSVSGVTLLATRPDGVQHTWTEGTLTEVSAGTWSRMLTPPTNQLGSWLVTAACTTPQPEAAAAYLQLVAVGDTDISDLTPPPLVAVPSDVGVFTLGPYPDEPSAIAAGVPSRGFYEDRWGFLRRRSVLGLVGNGVASDRAAFQAQIDWSASTGRPVYVPDGDYLIDSPLYARSGATVICAPDARLIRGYSTGGTTGLLMNEVMTTPVANFRWSGGTLANPVATNVGNTFCLNANDSLIEDVFCDEWHTTSRAFLIFGDRLLLRGIRAITAFDGGGIRYAGGDDFRCQDSYVECGDDCFQFVPGASSSGVLFDRTIRRGQYVNCQGFSHNARLMVAGLVSISETLHMVGSITDCAWIGVRGRGRQFATVDNTDSLGVIARLDFIGCQCDSTGEAGSPVGSFFVNRSSGAGAVEEIRLVGCTVLAPELEAVEINGFSGFPVGRVTIDKSYLDKSRTPPLETVVTQFCDGFTISNSTLVGNGTDVIVLGVGAVTMTNSLIEANLITEIDNGFSGIRVNAASGWIIRDNRFVERSGQTSARALTYTASTATGGKVYPNDYSGLTASQKIFPNATNNSGNQVLGGGVSADATGATLRWHEAGQTKTNFTATTQQNYTLPSAVPGLRFTFTVTGTGMMRILASGTDTIRRGANVTTPTTGSLTSTAQGDSVTVEGTTSSTWQVTSMVGTWTVA